MKLKQAKKVMLALLGAMALSLLTGGILVSGSAAAALLFVAAGVVLFFVFIAYNFSHWRCPHCGEYLGWDLGKGIPFCPHCHQRLDK